MPKKTTKKTALPEKLPYDEKDPASIIEYAGRLTGKSLKQVMDVETGIIGGTNSKGMFGQMVESYFGIRSNNDAAPDFKYAKMELKVAPLIEKGRKRTSKERMVLGIIDYNKVPEDGFNTFLKKGSHLLIIFYLWSEHTDITEYRIVKVVDWVPTEEELRIIREDWDVIQGFVERGKADLLSEKCTRFLAANTKGAGHGTGLRTQPFSDVLAKQRSLSFKPSFMTILYETHPDVRKGTSRKASGYDTVFHGEWDPDKPFSDYVIGRMDRFRGMTCAEIEAELGVSINRNAKQYYNKVAMAMLGVTGKVRIKEFEEANILMKTVRLLLNGTPKEDMSFPAFVPEEVMGHEWEESDFFSELDHEFFIPVFGFSTDDPESEEREDLVFLGAFFWYIPSSDLETVRGVWEDTKKKLIEGRKDFVKGSEERVSHVRPHDQHKRVDENGEDITRQGFWLNMKYVREVIRKGMSDKYSDYDR